MLSLILLVLLVTALFRRSVFWGSLYGRRYGCPYGGGPRCGCRFTRRPMAGPFRFGGPGYGPRGWF